MKLWIALVLAIFSINLETGDSLSCICHDPELKDKVVCEPAGECQYGVGKDACGCCDVCLKGPGEECGGPWGVLGDCGEQFICNKTPKNPDEIFPYDEQFAEGVCE